MQLRLNKFLAERLGISRREADDLIAAGAITVNGEPAKLGMKIQVGVDAQNNRGGFDKSDGVCYNGEIVPSGVKYTYLALNKPVGYVCSRKKQGEAETVYALLPPEFQKLKTVGRLDKDSSGLILLTNDGDFAFKMTHPKFSKTKIYEVELDRDLEPLHQQEISDFGVEIGDGVSRLGLTRLGRAVNDGSESQSYGDGTTGLRAGDDSQGDGSQGDGGRKTWQVEMTEGRNRQIRRTFAALGYEVVRLHRVQFGPYRLDGLAIGKWVKLPDQKL